MDNFEKRMMMKYVNKMIDDLDVGSYTFDDLYEILRDDVGIKNIAEIPEDGPSYRTRCALFKKEVKQVVANKLKSTKEKDSWRERRLNILKDIFELNEAEYEIIKYLILKDTNNYFNILGNTISGNDLRSFVAKYLKLRQGNFDRIKKNLKDKGLILSARYPDVELNEKIVSIFDNSSIKTIKQIKSALLGMAEKSELNWSDFNHIGKDRDLVYNVLKNAVEQKTKGVNILLYGNVGVGKTQFAKLVANKAKVDMFAVDFFINDKEADREDRLINLKSKQLVLGKMDNSCILFDEAEDVMNRSSWIIGKSSKALLNDLIENTPIPIFWTTNNIYNVDPAFMRRMTYAIEFKELTDTTRLNIWKKTLRQNKLKVKNDKIVELSKSYNVSPSLISNAVKMTKLVSGDENTFEHFVENIAKVVKRKRNVKNKVQEAVSNYNDEIANTDLDVKDLTQKIKKCNKLNFSLCLYGQPGTGKSLYARYLANVLGVEVIQKRASDLISPFVGQTEENIAKAFEEAKEKEAMLIIDEADSFLRTRNSAQRSWEVSQVNEMLTQMESNEYPFVCTTNLLDTLDEASLRRFTFKIKFDFMTQEQATKAFEHFFHSRENVISLNIKGLTAGDFATVKKKAEFLEISDYDELTKMLRDEVKIKQAKELKNVVGF